MTNLMKIAALAAIPACLTRTSKIILVAALLCLPLAGASGLYYTWSPDAANLTYVIGAGTPPSPQTIALSSLAPSSPLPCTPLQPATSWVSAVSVVGTPPPTTTPCSFAVWVDPTGLATGSYTTSIQLYPFADSVPVNLVVTAPPAPVPIAPGTLALIALALALGGLVVIRACGRFARSSRQSA